jgi:hypothetical protein
MDRLRANPRPLVLAGLAVAVIAVFFVVVGPLFNFSGKPQAEVAGTIPAQASVASPVEVDIGLDNVGTSIINPVCVLAKVSGPLIPDHAIFQGLDDEPFHSGTACGGSLNGQETISIKVYLRPTGTGRASIALSPAQRSTQLGQALEGTVNIAGT